MYSNFIGNCWYYGYKFCSTFKTTFNNCSWKCANEVITSKFIFLSFEFFSFPAPSLPRFDLISLIFFDAVSITIIAVAIHLTVVKIVENRYHYKINSCQVRSFILKFNKKTQKLKIIALYVIFFKLRLLFKKYL